MAIVLQQDLRKVDSITGRVFSGGRYYGDFMVNTGSASQDKFKEGVYCLQQSIQDENYIRVVTRTGELIATLGHKKSEGKHFSVLVGVDGLSFRTSPRTFQVLKDLFEAGETKLVIRDPLQMK